MKNVMKTMLFVSLMVPTLSHAVDAQTNQILTQKMSGSSSAGGASIKMVDKKYVIDAVDKLHGKVTIDLGSKGQVQVNNQKGGGVLIGSGSDGLAVVSNQIAENGTVIVQPPMEANTSITLVGRANDPSRTQYCSVRLYTDPQGNVLTGKSKEVICNKIGHALRLSEGKYVIYYNHTSLIIDLKQNERKIIPLREVLVPRQSEPVSFSLNVNTFTSEERLKMATQIFAMIDGFYSRESIPQLVNDLQNGKDVTAYMPYTWDNIKDLTQISIAGTWEVSSRFSQSVVEGKDDEFVSVLPGDYVIQWTIDGQSDVTHFSVN